MSRFFSGSYEPATQGQIDALKWAARATAQRVLQTGWPEFSPLLSLKKRRSCLDYSSEHRMLRVGDTQVWLSESGTLHRKIASNGAANYPPWPTASLPWPSKQEVELLGAQLEELPGSSF